MSETAIPKLHNPGQIHTPNGYSHVAEVTGGTIVFISGQVGLDASGKLAGQNDFAAQLRQVFENLKVALSAARATFNDVVKLNYYCADTVDLSTHFSSVRQIRDSYVNTSTPPTSTFVVVKRLVRPELLIEVEAVAVVPKIDRGTR
ncbi:MAG TPA: RidA family protein [Gemmatimonadaceae bacterium]|nr:RidA family protein [Gemmatimonadaceae bacterium]